MRAVSGNQNQHLCLGADDQSCPHSFAQSRNQACRFYAPVRVQIAIGLVKTHGVALAEAARQLGVSISAISKIIKRAS